MNLKAILRGKPSGLSPIGLDIGSSQIKAAQLRRSGAGWTMHAFTTIPRAFEGAPLDPCEAARVNDVLFRRGFVGHSVVVAVPDAMLLTVNLELPPRNEQVPLDQIARAEFARSVKTETDPFEFAYWDLPAPARAAKATHVMGVGCKHTDAEPIIDALELAGFEVTTIDVEAAALTRVCSPALAPPQEITALVDIGQRAVRLFVVHQGVVTYRRSLGGHGMQSLREGVAQQIDVKDDPEVLDYVLEHVSMGKEAESGDASHDTAAATATNASSSIAIEQAKRVIRGHFDAVLSEVTTSLSYAAHQYPDAPVRRALLTGGGASISGLGEYLASMLNFETRAVRCADLVAGAERVGAEENDRAAAFAGAMAIGLAQFDAGRAGREARP